MGNPSNPEMLVLARESRGMTQTALAKKTKITQAAVSKYESGVLEVPSDRLEEIARVLEYPTAFFFRGDRRYGHGSPCLYHRKRQSLPLSKQREVQATLNVRRLEIARLLQGVEIDTEAGFVRMDIEDFDSPEQVAQLVRKSWRLPLGPVQNLVSSIENAGGIVISGSFGTRKLDAISLRAPGQPPFFFVNKDIPGDRMRFTLAHEVGHVIMHTLPSVSQEREADLFAAELLMPAKEIKSDLASLTFQKLGPLKYHWKVAMSSLIRRAHTLNQITDRQYKRFMVQMSQMGIRLNEPYPISPEEPTVIRDVVDLHLRHYGYSTAELSQAVGLHDSEFCSLYLDQKPRLRLVE